MSRDREAAKARVARELSGRAGFDLSAIDADRRDEMLGAIVDAARIGDTLPIDPMCPWCRKPHQHTMAVVGHEAICHECGALLMFTTDGEGVHTERVIAIRGYRVSAIVGIAR